MSFTSLFFYPLIIIIILLLICIQSIFRNDARTANTISKSVLLVSSYYILASYDWRYCLCITAVSLVTWFCAIKISSSEKKCKKIWGYSAVIINVVLLCIFKYLNFFISIIADINGHKPSELKILLPIGISFYIFSAISYILDVLWGKMDADKSLLNVTLFLAFFPKLVCGPISRGHTFIPQLNEARFITIDNFKYGLQVYVFGLFKKLVLADNIAIFVDQVYHAPTAFDTLTVWLAVGGYFLQLYFDFSGYSDMAIGLSKILGYDLERNFNLPFSAGNVSDFWNRWHMSLTSWLNEYLFNPCAMVLTRKLKKLPKPLRKKYKLLPSYIATMITLLICGIWHGAGFTFIIFGLLHGIVSVIHELYLQHLGRKRLFEGNKYKLYGIICIILNYICINLIEVFFRATDVPNAIAIYKGLFTFHKGICFPQIYIFVGYFFLISATIIAYYRSKKNEHLVIDGFYPIVDLTTIKGLTIFFVICILTFLFAYFGDSAFIYGNF